MPLVLPAIEFKISLQDQIQAYGAYGVHYGVAYLTYGDLNRRYEYLPNYSVHASRSNNVLFLNLRNTLLALGHIARRDTPHDVRSSTGGDP